MYFSKIGLERETIVKINIILPFTFLTGGIRVIFLYANYLTQKGHDVVCYVPMKAYKFNKGNIKMIKSSIGNTFIRGHKVKWFECRFKIKLIPIINNKFIRKADISIATAWPTAYDVYYLDVNRGKKVYFIQDYEIWSGEKEKVDKSYQLDLNRITITNRLKTLLENKFNSKSTVIYNGLDKDEFLVGDKKHNLKISILMLYNNSENKGAKEGVEILKEISNKYDVDIKLFGYTNPNNLPENFKFYENPTRKTLINLYRDSDIYLFTSKFESWGLPVMEAMANKCAVVGNNTGCLAEIGINNINSIIIDNCDYKEMKFQLENLLNDTERLSIIQQNGYELATKYEWEDSFKKFEKYLKNLL